MEMDKQPIVEESQKPVWRPNRVVSILALALLLFAVAFVGLAAFSFFYVHDLQKSHDDEIQKLKLPAKQDVYDVDVRLNNTRSSVHERVSVYEEQELAFSIIMDSESGYIESLMTMDYQGRIVAKYDAESEICYFAEMDDTFPSFKSLVNTLKERNGGSVSNATMFEYMEGGRLGSADVIPDLMTPYCSINNSHWLIKLDGDVRVKRNPVVVLIIVFWLLSATPAY